jgi:hypothetical protein
MASLLPHDPIPWLMAQDGRAAVRARRRLGVIRSGDDTAVALLERELREEQLPDGSFGRSPMKTAGVLNLLCDLKASGAANLVARGVSYLLSALESQPGYERAGNVRPGSLRTPCDLCGFFGPYENRSVPDVLARGAREMNFYREYEPLLGPQSPVRDIRTASGGSCFAWGLIPLCYTIEAVCRAGHADDGRLRPAINALLGVQREGGGWCRNLGSGGCTIHAIRALGAHPKLRRSEYADRALSHLQTTPDGPPLGPKVRWGGSRSFAVLQAVAGLHLPTARRMVEDALEAAAQRQRKDGTFGDPYRIERVAAVLVAAKTVRRSAS